MFRALTPRSLACALLVSFLSGTSVLAAGHPEVIQTRQLAQLWNAGSWEKPAVQLDGVQAGDAIIVLGLYWVSAVQGVVPAPSDSAGKLKSVVDQARVMARNNPPVFAQIYSELNAAAGTHVITPPDLGGTGGDGTLYVVHVRGISELVASGDVWSGGSRIPSVAVSLSAPARAGDLLLGVGGYDNVAQFPNAGMRALQPAAGMVRLGVQNDSSNCVPSEASQAFSLQDGLASMSWTWSDPGANVVSAALAAFR